MQPRLEGFEAAVYESYQARRERVLDEATPEARRWFARMEHAHAAGEPVVMGEVCRRCERMVPREWIEIPSDEEARRILAESLCLCDPPRDRTEEWLAAHGLTSVAPLMRKARPASVDRTRAIS